MTHQRCPVARPLPSSAAGSALLTDSALAHNERRDTESRKIDWRGQALSASPKLALSGSESNPITAS